MEASGRLSLMSSQAQTGPSRARGRHGDAAGPRAPGPWHAAAGRKRSRGHGDAGPCHDACFARSEARRPRVSRSVSAGGLSPEVGGRGGGSPRGAGADPTRRQLRALRTPPPPPGRREAGTDPSAWGRVPSKARGPRARDARKVSAPPAKGHKTHGKTSVPKGPLKAAIIKHRWLLPEATPDGGSGAPALCSHTQPRGPLIPPGRTRRERHALPHPQSAWGLGRLRAGTLLRAL